MTSGLCMLANMSCSCSVKVLLKSTASSGHSEAMSANSDTQCNNATCYHMITMSCLPYDIIYTFEQSILNLHILYNCLQHNISITHCSRQYGLNYDTPLLVQEREINFSVLSATVLTCSWWP